MFDYAVYSEISKIKVKLDRSGHYTGLFWLLRIVFTNYWPKYFLELSFHIDEIVIFVKNFFSRDSKEVSLSNDQIVEQKITSSYLRTIGMKVLHRK